MICSLVDNIQLTIWLQKWYRNMISIEINVILFKMITLFYIAAFFILSVNGLMVGVAVESALSKTTSSQAFNYVGWTFYVCGVGGILALITSILFIIHLYLAVYY